MSDRLHGQGQGGTPTGILPAAAFVLAIVVLALPVVATAFGEEHGSDIDTDEHISTHHLYLTRALAVCAGFATSGKDDPFDNPQEAERIAIADQLSDSEILHHGDTVSTNCTAKPYVMPIPAMLACPAGTGTATVMPVTGIHHGTSLLPVPKWKPGAGCFTSRFGPHSGTFHFPDADSLAAMRAWAFGATPVLAGEAQFAFGGYFSSPWSADCYARHKEPVDTGKTLAGSPEALGTYLHALGDFHSHAVCREHWSARSNPPWHTHTITTSQPGCAFIDHARELGCPANRRHDSVFTPPPGDEYVQHATTAALGIYDELVAYGTAHGIAPRLGDTAADRAWLEEQSWRFVTGWSYLGGAAARRDFANALANACVAHLRTSAVPAPLRAPPCAP